jgi:hypothetical protein
MAAFMARLGLVLVGMLAVTAGWAAPVTVVFNLPGGSNLPGNVDDGEQDEIVYQDDYITTSSVDLGTSTEKKEAEKPPTGLADRLSLGVDATLIEDQQFFVVPAGYRITPNVKLGVAVPFIRREGKDGDTFGLGDVTASLGYRWGNPLKVLGITTAFVKAPTGDPEKEDHGEFLSTGTWDYALYQTFIRRFDRWRGELTAGYRLNTEGDFDVDGADVKLENGDVINLILGAEREIDPVPGLIGYLKVDVRRIGDAKLTIDGAEQDAADAFTTVDLLPGVKYFLQAGAAVRVGLRIPVNDMDARDPALDFQFVQTF